MAFDRNSDPGGIKRESADLQRDTAAKGGPAVGLGKAQNRTAASPVDEDLQIQAAAKSGKNQATEKEEAQSDGNLELPEGK